MLKGVGLVAAELDADGSFTSDQTGVIQTEAGDKGIRIKGYFNLSISGTWSGSLTIQRSFDNGVTWRDIRNYATNNEDWDQEIESGILYRIGFKTGNYTSGTANVRISK